MMGLLNFSLLSSFDVMQCRSKTFSSCRTILMLLLLKGSSDVFLFLRLPRKLRSRVQRRMIVKNRSLWVIVYLSWIWFQQQH